MNSVQVAKGVVAGGVVLALLRRWRIIVLGSLVVAQMAANALGTAAPYVGGALAAGVVVGIWIILRRREKAREDALRAQIIEAAATERQASARAGREIHQEFTRRRRTIHPVTSGDRHMPPSQDIYG